MYAARGIWASKSSHVVGFRIWVGYRGFRELGITAAHVHKLIFLDLVVVRITRNNDTRHSS